LNWLDEQKPSRRLWISAAVIALALHVGGAALAIAHLQTEEADDALGATAIEIGLEMAAVRREVTDLPPGPDTDASAASPPERSFAYLRSLDAGKGERIPTLHEVTEVIARRAEIHVELKGPGTAGPVAAFIRASGGRDDDFLVSSFDHHQLTTMRQLRPAVRRGALIAGVPLQYAELALPLGAYSLNPSAEFLPPALVEDAHRRGLRVYVFTVNHAEEIARMRALSVDGVFSDYPDRVIRDGKRPTKE